MSPAKRLIFLSLFLFAWGGCNLGTPTGGGTGVDGLTGTLVSANGAPVAGAWVRVYAANDSTTALAKGAAGQRLALAVDSVQTGADGTFQIPGLAGGSYNIVATAVRGDTTFSYFLQGLVFVKRLDLGTDTLKLSGSVTIDVRSMGLPVEGALCFIPGSPFAGKTNAQGECLVTGLPPGRFEIVLTHAGYQVGVMGDLQVLSGILTSGGLLNLVGLGTPPTAKPVLVSPSAIPTVTPLSGLLVWRTFPSAAAYHVQLAADSAFSSIVLQDSVVTDTTKAYGPLAVGSYYWRVRARNTAGYGPWSTAIRFVTVGSAGASAPKMIARWDFEEGTGATLNDRTSNAHDGSITNGTWTTGVRGGGLSFNGTSSQVLVPFKADLNLRQFTISTWFKTTRTNGQALVTRQTSGGSALPWNYRLVTTEADTFDTLVVPAGHGLIDYNPANATPIGTTFLADGAWHQLTGVLRDTVLELYVDGVLERASLPGIRPDTTGTEPLRLGASAFGDGAHFQGILDEVRIYNGPLTALQIDSLYRAFKPEAGPTDTTLIASQDADIVGSAPFRAEYIENATITTGRRNAMPIGVYDLNTVGRSLIQFRIPSNVTGGKIAKAVLRISTIDWVDKNAHPDSVRLYAHRLLRSWKEGTSSAYDGFVASAAMDGVTALERFYGDQDGSEDWNAKLVGLDDVDAASVPAATSTRPNKHVGSWDFDVTALAKSWADDPAQNFGVIVVSDIPPDDGQVVDLPWFHSKDSAQPDSLKPSLILTFQ